MTKKHSTKRSLIASVLILCLCITSLVGTTFAWFTDEVTSGNNIIKTGKLDIVMEYWDGTQWVDAEGKVLQFRKAGGNPNEEVLWEPGCTYEIPKFRVRNVGSLAAKIIIRLNGIKGDEKLLDVIDLTTTITNMPQSVIDGSYGSVLAPYNNATVPLMYGTDVGTLIFDWSLMGQGNVAPHSGHTDTSPEFIISGHMDENAGNEYQEMMIQGISITVLAAQEVSEYDSFGREYDKDAPFPEVKAPAVEISSFEGLKAAIENGKTDLVLTEDIYVAEGFVIDENITINGNGNIITRYGTTSLFSRAATTVTPYTGNLITVKSGATLVLENVVVDGGAIWVGEINEVLGRGTVNAGITATGALVATEGNGSIVLGEGAVLQNNDGANAVSLVKGGNGTLTLNGGEIINNTSAAGAIWAGGAIVINDGKINGNHATSIGGAIRVVSTMGSLTMNGGEMNHNYSNGNGGAIWSGNTCKYYFNGGEMAYNYAASAGGAIYGGSADKYYVTGDFKMHHNAAGELGNAIRFTNYQHTEFNMTGGHIYANDAESGACGIFADSNYLNLHGGKIEDSIDYNGNLYLTVGTTEVTGVVNFDNGTRGDNKILLGKEFVGLKFIVDVNDPLFNIFMLDPADDYVYTDGDEAKLICMNEGYSTYWDAEAGVFKLQTN